MEIPMVGTGAGRNPTRGRETRDEGRGTGAPATMMALSPQATNRVPTIQVFWGRTHKNTLGAMPLRPLIEGRASHEAEPKAHS